MADEQYYEDAEARRAEVRARIEQEVREDFAPVPLSDEGVQEIVTLRYTYNQLLFGDPGRKPAVVKGILG